MSAVALLKECYANIEESANSQSYRKSCTYAWTFLYDYAQFYLAKHLSVLLKQAPSLAFELPGVLLRRLIDRSLLYLVDGEGLEAIL